MSIESASFRQNPEALPEKAVRRRSIGYTVLEHVREPEGIISITDSQTGFELTVTNKLYSAIRARGGMSALKPAFETLRESVLGDPFGDNNVDPRKKGHTGHNPRIVHTIPEDSPFYNLMPTEMVVKTTGLDIAKAQGISAELEIPQRSSATEQFRIAHAFSNKQKQEAPEGLFGFIRPVEVYGAIREPQPSDGTPPREWLLMEKVPVNRPVEHREMIYNGRLVPGFCPRDYPALGSLVVGNPSQYRGVVPIDNLVKAIAKNYPWAATFLGDFWGENLLETIRPRNERGVVEKEYVIIDPELSIHPKA